MTSYDFTTVSHGKCIIVGEHAVLRGHPAIVLPVKSRQLTLHYSDNDQPLQADFSGDFGDDAHLLFWSVFERGLSLLGKSLGELTGRFTLHNIIPIGCGMGASAALSSALANWFSWRSWINDDERFEFAKRLEDLFHGTSSGVDILGSMSQTAMRYVVDEPATMLQQAWEPQWYLLYSGRIGKTSQCVNKVKQLWLDNPSLAERIDTQMADAVTVASRALMLPQNEGRPLLAEAINKARICFTQWDLTGADLEANINQLLSAGALAAKPTGSGDGGFTLSLWDETPPETLMQKMIPL